MRTLYAHNGEIKLAYTDFGGAGGTPLLLLTAFGVSRYWWPPGWIDALADAGFHVAACDYRDFGESTRLSEPDASMASYSAEDVVDDVIAVMDALGWPSAHLFGHSLGGMVAQRTALRAPGRVLGITSSASLPGSASRLRVLRYLGIGVFFRLARLRDHADDVELGVAVARVLASPGYPFDEDTVRATVRREAELGIAGDFRNWPAQARALRARWHGGSVTQLRVPTLVVHGAQDPLVHPAAGRATAAAVPGARLIQLPGVGHDLPRALWPRLAEEVRRTAASAAAGCDSAG